MQHDWSFSFLGKRYQVLKKQGSGVKPKSKLVIRKHLDGNLSIWYKEEKLKVHVIAKQTPKQSKTKSIKKERTFQITKTPWRETNALFFLKSNNRTTKKNRKP